MDFTRGSGFSNWRPVPSGTKQLTFSKNPATPRIAYVAVGTQLRRYDTGTNSYVDTGHFPAAFNIDTWLQQDKDDGWFVALGAGSTTVVAWNSATGQSLSRSFSGLDEPYLERDGRYIMVNASPTQIWDLATNTVSSISAAGERLPGACAGAALVLHGDRCEYRDGHHAAVAGGPVPGAQQHPVHDAERVLPRLACKRDVGADGMRSWGTT